MNLFRLRPTDPLDMKYLRTCSVYRLLKRGKIGKARAIELLHQRHGKFSNIEATVEIWKSGPIRNMAP